MGNTKSCCFSLQDTNTTPSDNRESSSVPSIESIQNDIKKENATESIDKLIEMLENVLSKIKGEEENGSITSVVECLGDTTRSASQLLDFFKKEAGNFSNLEIISQGVASAATNVLNAIGGTHFIFLGLTLVANTCETYMKMKSNDSACKELLETLLDLAKDLKKFKEAVPEENEKVWKAIQEIFVGTVNCNVYMGRVSASRFLATGVMESHVQKTKEIIKDLRASLTLTTTTHIARGVSTIRRQIPTHSVPCPLEPLGFQQEGIEDQVADVKKKLDIGGSEQARAVIIVGTGGTGKSTLAASVINSLKLSFRGFKYSMVTIDEKTPDKNSHILKLQSDIIFHFTEDYQYLKDTKEGQEKLQAAMVGKCCFLYIDNVVDSYYIKQLLPSELLPQKPSKENSESDMSGEKSENQMQKTKIRILITSRPNDLKPILKINTVEHEMRELSHEAAKKLLSTIIFQVEKPAQDFDEEGKISELALACQRIPLLLSVFGNHLKDNRDKSSYEEAIKALKEGNIDRYSAGEEELLSETLMFVYDRMKDEEAKEAFLDICTYFYGFPWDLVAHMVDSATLSTLYNKNLVIKSETGKMIVHDILRSMGVKKAKDTRLMNYEEFFNINDDESKLKNVRGLVLMNSTFLATLETRHLSVMRHSLRFLVLGDCVRVDGPPCDRAFKKLRYLQVGDVKDFPFNDVSKMEKLNVFENSSKSGMGLAQIPPNLKYLRHQILHRDCNELERLPLKNLKFLKEFIVQAKISVRLPERFKLPASLEQLRLISCEQLPEAFGHLSALQNLALDKCDLKCLPQTLKHCVKLRTLSMQDCKNMISLGEGIFESLCLLKDLCLTGCVGLETLPADLGMLTALEDLNIGGCENLKVLPESFGGLKSLKTLGLTGCKGLQRLPDRFGEIRIKHLTLESLSSLKQIPESLGGISCLETLLLKSCDLLEFVPDNLVQLTNLNKLVIENCRNIRDLPKNIENLRSLEEVIFSSCPLLKRLPNGFEALETLKCMKLSYCKSLVDLPDGLGKLKMLKILWIQGCFKVKTLPQDFENLTISKLFLCDCPSLEGTAMDRIVKLQYCYSVIIAASYNLIGRWWDMLTVENNSIPMIVRTNLAEYFSSDFHTEECNRAGRVGLLCGNCIQLDNTTNELKHHSSMSIPNNTTVAVISLQLDHYCLLQPIVDKAKERARNNCAGQLRIIYVCRKTDYGEALNEEETTEKIIQTLMTLSHDISYVIPYNDTDIRRFSLIGESFFDNSNVFNDAPGPNLLCFMVDVKEDDKGGQILSDGECVTEDEISEKSGEKLPEDSDEEIESSQDSDEEIESSDGIIEFVNCIRESKTQSPSGQCSRLPDENMVGKFIQKLKNNKIYHFSDNKVKVDNLQGKTIAIILIDQNHPDCMRLQQIYHDIKLKHSDFEAVWIPLWEEEDFGFGTYSRAIECMPWLTLADPKLIKIDDIKDRSPRVIIINSGGTIGNPNGLSLLMSWGADAYPFMKGNLSQLDLKLILEILFQSTGIKELNNKLIFLYADGPIILASRMKWPLEKLVRKHGQSSFEIVYVGSHFAGTNDAEMYEVNTQSMNWTKLSFEEMMRFWNRCKYLSDEMVQESNWSSTLNRFVKALVGKSEGLVVVDGDGIVTTNGIDVVEMACESSYGKDDEVDIMMKEELRQSLVEGKCTEMVRRYFRDELNHPQHHHAMRVRREERSSNCVNCGSSHGYWPNRERIYRCDVCHRDLCWDCWKVFVKEEVRSKRQPTQEN